MGLESLEEECGAEERGKAEGMGLTFRMGLPGEAERKRRGGELLLLGSSVCPMRGLLGITWQNRSDCSCR